MGASIERSQPDLVLWLVAAKVVQAVAVRLYIVTASGEQAADLDRCQVRDYFLEDQPGNGADRLFAHCRLDRNLSGMDS